jgi:hypothetical protein
MKKLQFFFMLVLISLLGVTQVKADTIHVYLPSGNLNVCESNGFDTFIIHKPLGFASTVWFVNATIVGSGDSITWTPTTMGDHAIGAIWNSNTIVVGISLYPSAPSHAAISVHNGPGTMINNNVYMCSNQVTLSFQFNGGIDGAFHWGRIGDINYLPTENPVTITDPGIYFNYKENICGITIDTFNVIQLPFSAPILSDTIFCNQNSNTTFDAGTGWSSISWSTGESTQSITPVITTDGVHNYTLTVTNVCGTYNSSATIEVQHFPNPGFPIPIGPYCNDTTLIVNPNPNYVYDTYTWSTGDTTQFIYVNDDLSWTCTVTQGGCSKSSSRSVRFYEEPTTPEVCVVTVDASMLKNKIVWSSDEEPDAGDPEYKMIESYNIYKLINTWTLIGTVPVDSNHVFTDMSSNPPTQSAMYKITSVDGCGNESEKSPYHRTILLLANQGAYPGQIPLSWNHYVDESGSFVVSQYYIYKGPSMSQLSLWDSVPGIMNSYIDTGIYAQTFYQIVATKDGGCNFAPAMVMTPGKGGNSPKSIQDGMIFSNPTSSQVGITENKIDVTIYPNPSSNGIFTVKGENITLIQVYNTVGQLILSTTENNTSINLSSYSDGIYYAKITNNLGSTSKKLVKQ